jgi:hypothetical protein
LANGPISRSAGALAREIKPQLVQLIEGGHFVPAYAQSVSMTPQVVLDKSQEK